MGRSATEHGLACWRRTRAEDAREFLCTVLQGTQGSCRRAVACLLLCVRVWRAVWGSQLATRLSEMPAHACIAVECVFECGSLGTLVKWPAQAAWRDQRAISTSRWPPPRRWQGCARRACYRRARLAGRGRNLQTMIYSDPGIKGET